MSTESQDKRLLERSARGDASTGERVAKAAESLPDLAAEIEAPSAEAIEQLRSDLVEEQLARRQRIIRFAEERAAPPAPRPPVIPLNESEL